MPTSTALVTIALGLLCSTSAAINYLGFTTGIVKSGDSSAKLKADFVAEFKAAQGLQGAPGLFNNARLYTSIQAFTADDPVEAFGAAIDTETSLLLGVWASGVDNIDNEISALKKALDQYGDDFTSLVIGVCIGSEDLYRNSAKGVTDKAGTGAQPDTLVNFISDFRTAFSDTGLGSILVGHVDTWDAWSNTSNKAVIDSVDFIGLDEYPYFEDSDDENNSIKNSGSLFDEAYEATVAAAGDKDVWITETGWPISGTAEGKAVASLDNAKSYWDEIGCGRLFNKMPVFWYTLGDTSSTQDFALTESLSTNPRFDLSCPVEESVLTSSVSSSTRRTTQVSSPEASSTTSSTKASRSATTTSESASEPSKSTTRTSASGPGSTSGSNTPHDEESKHHKGLSIGAKAGIAVGVVVFVLIGLILILLFLRRRRPRHAVNNNGIRFVPGSVTGGEDLPQHYTPATAQAALAPMPEKPELATVPGENERIEMHTGGETDIMPQQIQMQHLSRNQPQPVALSSPPGSDERISPQFEMAATPVPPYQHHDPQATFAPELPGSAIPASSVISPYSQSYRHAPAELHAWQPGEDIWVSRSPVEMSATPIPSAPYGASRGARDQPYETSSRAETSSLAVDDEIRRLEADQAWLDEAILESARLVQLREERARIAKRLDELRNP